MNGSIASPSARFRFFETVKRSILVWDRPLSAAVLTGLIFLGITSFMGVPWRSSGLPYFNYLADAYLHGQLNLRLIPALTRDLSFFDGKYYLYWGPLPAVFAMPFVALFGVQASDILQSITVGALNVGIFSLLLHRCTQRGFINLTPMKRALLVLFFSLGTMQTPLLAVGTVWYLVQLESVTFALLAYLAAFSLKGWKAFFWTGCAIAGILLTRPSAVFVGLFLAWYLLRSHGSWGFRKNVIHCLAGSLPCLVGFLFILANNLLRFGNPLDDGYKYHLMAPKFMELAHQYGVFNIHYLPVNLYYDYIYYPLATLGNGKIESLGGSLFLLSPLFFAALYVLWQDRRDPDIWFLFGSVVMGSLPSLLIMAPGSIHFGPRYLLDIIAPLLLLTARGIRQWRVKLILPLVGVSVLQYLLGAIGMVVVWFK